MSVIQIHFKIPINIFLNNINPHNKLISTYDITNIITEFKKSIIYYDNNKKKYIVLNLENNTTCNDILYYKNNDIEIELNKSDIKFVCPTIDYQPKYITDKNKVNLRKNDIDNEIKNINDIKKEIQNIIQNNNINYKNDHIPKNINKSRFTKKNDTWFSIILNNIITNNTEDIQFYINNIKNNFNVDNEQNELNRIINNNKIIKNNDNNSDFNRLKKIIFIKYLFSIIKSETENYLNYLNITQKNIYTNKYCDKILFNDVIKNHIFEIKNTENTKYGILDENLFEKKYYFKTENIMAYSRNFDIYKNANGILLVKSKSDNKWNIFPCACDCDKQISFKKIESICNEVVNIHNDTGINIFTNK